MSSSPPTPIKIFVSSPGDLADERVAAKAVCDRLNRKPHLEGHLVLRPYLYEERTPHLIGKPGQTVVDEEMLRAEDADIVLCMFWHRFGTPFEDDSGTRWESGTAYELEQAYRRTRSDGRPLILLYRCRRDPPYEHDPEQFQKVKSFFGRFEGEQGDLKGNVGRFESLEELKQQFEDDLERLLRRWLPGEVHAREARAEEPPRHSFPRRQWPLSSDVPLPERPYPLLSPYDHPALFAGREEECELVRERLRDRRHPVLALFASSGAGKSSLLQAGVVPAERDAGRAVAYIDHPEEAALGDALVRQLLVVPEDFEIEDPIASEAALEALLEHLRQAGQPISGRPLPPLLVLDQFEHLFRADPEEEPTQQELLARARVGLLLSRTLFRFTTELEPLCRWLLCYRHDYHGIVESWLKNVLAEVERLQLGHSSHLRRQVWDRCASFSLGVFGAPVEGASGAPEPEQVRSCFLRAIETPLQAAGAGYPYRFEAGHAVRLAEAFGRQRSERPELPLVPELQVVLERLRLESRSSDGVLVVPEDSASLVQRALRDHLFRVLERIYPGGSQEARRDRTLVLLALRRLALDDGRRAEPLARSELAPMLAEEADRVLEGLAAPEARILVQRFSRRAGEVWELAHDTLARLVVHATETLDELGELDEDALSLRNAVTFNTRLWTSGGEAEKIQSTRLSLERFALIHAHPSAWLESEAQRSWFDACRDRCRADLMGGDPGRGLEALASLASAGHGFDPPSAERLLDLFEKGPPLLGEDYPSVLLAATPSVPEIVSSAWRSHCGPLATLLWQLDRLASERPEHAERAASLRHRLLQLLPAAPTLDTEELAEIEAGRFEMGGERYTDEQPVHSVALSGFCLGRTAVTREQAGRLLDLRGTGADREPATGLTWFEAYLYAAWLGGRLPTEAEWEYACRAGRRTEYCSGNDEKDLRGVGWYAGNSGGRVHEVAELPASPWGLYDMHGNVWEWCADWFDYGYGPEEQVEPWGPFFPLGNRVLRGGSWLNDAGYARSAYRSWSLPRNRNDFIGLRVRLPAPEQSGS